MKNRPNKIKKKRNGKKIIKDKILIIEKDITKDKNVRKSYIKIFSYVILSIIFIFLILLFIGFISL